MYSGLCCPCVLLQDSTRQLVILLYFLMFVSELVLGEGEFTPGLCSREGGILG